MRIKKFLTILLALSVAAIGTSCGAQSEPTPSTNIPVYHSDAMADYPILSVIDDNPRIGDESNFLRIAKYTEGEGLQLEDYSTGDFELEANAQYVVLAYLRNGADPKYGDELACKYPVLNISVPKTLKAGETGQLTAAVSWGAEEGTSMRVDNLLIKTAEESGDLTIEWGNFRVQGEAVKALYYIEGDDQPEGGPIDASDFDDETVISRMFYLPDIAPGYEHAVAITVLLRTYKLSD